MVFLEAVDRQRLRVAVDQTPHEHLLFGARFCGANGKCPTSFAISAGIIGSSAIENEIIRIAPDHPDAFASGMRFDGYHHLNHQPEHAKNDNLQNI